jgi:hypothetical protein
MRSLCHGPGSSALKPGQHSRRDLPPSPDEAGDGGESRGFRMTS